MSARCRPDRWSDTTPEGAVMIIDCDTCTVRGAACADCVVTVLLGAAPERVELDGAERAAIAVLADSGLVPPLRLLRPEPGIGGAGNASGAGPAPGDGRPPGDGRAPGEQAAARTVNCPSPFPRRPGGRRAAG